MSFLFSQRDGGEQAAELVVFVGRARHYSAPMAPRDTPDPNPRRRLVQYPERLGDHVYLLRRKPTKQSRAASTGVGTTTYEHTVRIGRG